MSDRRMFLRHPNTGKHHITRESGLRAACGARLTWREWEKVWLTATEWRDLRWEVGCITCMISDDRTHRRAAIIPTGFTWKVSDE